MSGHQNPPSADIAKPRVLPVDHKDQIVPYARSNPLFFYFYFSEVEGK